jgi:transposase-like protein
MVKKETLYGETEATGYFRRAAQLLAGADPKTAFVKDALLDDLKKAVAERALNAEIDHHLDKGEEDGRCNSRNG